MRTQCIIAIFPLWSHFNAEDIRSVMSKHTDILGLSLRNTPAQRGTIFHMFNFCQQCPLLPSQRQHIHMQQLVAYSFCYIFVFPKGLFFSVLALETWPIAGRTKVKWMKLDWGWNEGSETVVPAPSQRPGSTTACRTRLLHFTGRAVFFFKLSECSVSKGGGHCATSLMLGARVQLRWMDTQ